MIYLVGVNHEAARYKQARGLTESNLAFIEVIQSAIKEHDIGFLAEEEQPECLIRLNAISILEAIHRGYRVPHGFIDPNSRERKAIRYRNCSEICGLEKFRTQVSYPLSEKDENCESEIEKIALAHEIAHQFPIREGIWLSELKKANAQNILLVCGDIHLHTFPKLLRTVEAEAEVVREGVGVDYSAIEYKAFEYAKDNHMFEVTDCFCCQNKAD
jgi:hypothetical protein